MVRYFGAYVEDTYCSAPSATLVLGHVQIWGRLELSVMKVQQQLLINRKALNHLVPHQQLDELPEGVTLTLYVTSVGQKDWGLGVSSVARG